MQQAYTSVYACCTIEQKRERNEIKMNILLYIALFLIGIVVGNFWQKAIYKIPRNISIIKKNVSYIDSDNKSEFSKKMLQLFYLLLGGISFVVFGKMLEIDINNLRLSSIIMYLFTILYLSTLIIIAGIDQKYIKIDKKITTSGIIISMIYIIYLYIIDPSSIYFNTICLGIYLVLLTVDTIFLRRYAKNSYTVGILMLLNIILIFSEKEILAYTTVIAMMEILIYMLTLKIQQKKNGNKRIKLSEVPVGYFISVGNIIALFMLAFIQISGF